MAIALQKNDAKDVYFEAHSLKGASMTFGANMFAALLHTIEEAAIEGRLDRLESILENVNQEFRRMQSSLAVLKKRRSEKG